MDLSFEELVIGLESEPRTRGDGPTLMYRPMSRNA